MREEKEEHNVDAEEAAAEGISKIRRNRRGKRRKNGSKKNENEEENL